VPAFAPKPSCDLNDEQKRDPYDREVQYRDEDDFRRMVFDPFPPSQQCGYDKSDGEFPEPTGHLCSVDPGVEILSRST